jgi:hypothetical protein
MTALLLSMVVDFDYPVTTPLFCGLLPSGCISSVMCWMGVGPLAGKGEAETTSMGTHNAISRAICMGNSSAL